jgi:hypothetical protein
MMNGFMKAALLLVLTAVIAAGCRNNNEPTTPDQQAYFTADPFTGTLAPGGVALHGIDVLQTADVAITLVGLTTAGTNTTVSAPMKFVLGTYSADQSTCVGTTTVTASPALTAHINQQLTLGGYCLSIADAGSLSGSVDFSVLIRQSANVTPGGQAATETFSSNLYPGETIARSFAAAAKADAQVTLTSVTPAAGIGLGLGATTDGSNCMVHKAVVSTPGEPAVISATADPGGYCVKVFDPGGLAQRVVFNIEIKHQ